MGELFWKGAAITDQGTLVETFRIVVKFAAESHQSLQSTVVSEKHKKENFSFPKSTEFPF